MATKNNEKTKKNAPTLIIGAVLLMAVMFGVYCSRSGNNTAGNSNSAKTPAQTKSIPANAPPGANPPNSFGSPSAAVTIEEFADFQCPQCGVKHSVFNEIKSMYGSRIYFVFRHLPLSIHDKAYDAAVAAEAAGMQGKFWDMQNLLFNNHQAWSASPGYKQTWREYATRIGLDVNKWESDMAGIAAKGRVDADMQRAKVIGVNSTPSVYVNGQSLPFEQMTVDGLKTIIDAELAKGGNKPAQAAPAGNANASGANTGSK